MRQAITAVPLLLGLTLAGQVGIAAASECGEQIRVLDDRYSLSVTASGEIHRDVLAVPAADQTMSSGAGGATKSSAGMDTVPNTGGLANSHNSPVESLDAAQRDHMREALLAAHRADAIGDGTTCAAKVSEARRIVQGEPAGPRAR